MILVSSPLQMESYLPTGTAAVIDAALFTLQIPLLKDVVMVEAAGLGRIFESGTVITQ